MTQTGLTYRTNQVLFSNHYLTDHLRDTEQWNKVDENIKKTDQIIDEVIYDLYNLNENEIETVEQTVKSDD